MKQLTIFLVASLFLIVLAACVQDEESHESGDGDHGDEIPEGPNGGRLLIDGDFALELSIFEAGIDPEYRVWVTDRSRPVDPDSVSVNVTLDRLGEITDDVRFQPQGEYLRGDTVIYEPHSFDVTVDARYAGDDYRWHFENHEGRVTIPPVIVDEANIQTETIGPAVIRDYVTVYGRAVSNPENVSHVTARFGGIIVSVRADIGDEVKRGAELAVIEADDSLTRYSIKAPIAGTVTERHANPGEATGTRTLFTIVDPSSLWAELAIFPSDRSRVSVGAPVSIRTAVGDMRIDGEIEVLSPIAGNNQSVSALVLMDNRDDLLAAGMYLTGEVEVGQYEVPLAVKRTGLQSFRDFTVVYARFDDTFEVRMLELGRQDDIWVEVLGGIDPGNEYVTTNSYLIKADIEKSGASHDH